MIDRKKEKNTTSNDFERATSKQKVNFHKKRFVPARCAVCNGFGTVSNEKITCHACGGKGYIIIDQETGEEKKEKG